MCYNAVEHFIGYVPEGCITQNGKTVEISTKPSLQECLQAGLLCNDAVLKQSEQTWVISGDPTEGALLVSARKVGLEYAALLKQMPRLDQRNAGHKQAFPRLTVC
jgi:Ca2+-transporting ATPase